MHIHFAIGRPVVGAALLLTISTACIGDLARGAQSSLATEQFAPALGVNIAAMTRKSDALYVQDLVVGGGTAAGAKQVVAVIYTGWLANGTKFDSNTGQAPLTFTLGTHEVIDGWDQGVEGMRVGGRRRLVIGAALGYGAAGSGPIPPNSTLVFDVELRAVQ